jgi:serine/threonine protein phosphatase PrpC
MRFAVYQVSRKGGREKNEDRMGYCYTRDSGLFALADGMGGHPEGEVASQMALQTLAARFQKRSQAAASPTRCVFCRNPSSPATTSCCATPPSAR